MRRDVSCQHQLSLPYMHGIHFQTREHSLQNCTHVSELLLLKKAQSLEDAPCPVLPIGRTGVRIAGRVPRNMDWLATIFAMQQLAAHSPEVKFTSISGRSCSIGGVPGFCSGPAFR